MPNDLTHRPIGAMAQAESQLRVASDKTLNFLFVSSHLEPGPVRTATALVGLCAAGITAAGWAGYGLTRLLGRPAVLVPAMVLAVCTVVVGSVLAFGAATWLIATLLVPGGGEVLVDDSGPEGRSFKLLTDRRSRG